MKIMIANFVISPEIKVILLSMQFCEEMLLIWLGFDFAVGLWTSISCWLRVFNYGRLLPLWIRRALGGRWFLYLLCLRRKRLGMIIIDICLIRRRMRSKFGLLGRGSRNMYGNATYFWMLWALGLMWLSIFWCVCCVWFVDSSAGYMCR